MKNLNKAIVRLRKIAKNCASLKKSEDANNNRYYIYITNGTDINPALSILKENKIKHAVNLIRDGVADIYIPINQKLAYLVWDKGVTTERMGL